MPRFADLKPLLKLVPPETAAHLRGAAARTPRTLYETLARLPRDGVGARVFQTRWQSKGIEGCFWEVSRVQLKLEGQHGKAWGRLVWRGKPVGDREERIPGGLKYMWTEGVSAGTKLKAVQPRQAEVTPSAAATSTASTAQRLQAAKPSKQPSQSKQKLRP